jgi:hypothetical protein
MKTQSTESLSFLLCFANFACSGLWCIYGSLLGDNFILVTELNYIIKKKKKTIEKIKYLQ